jgi:transglutaminase-like putative cysteine protease
VSPAQAPAAQRHVASELGFTAADEVILVLALAPAASAGELVTEHLAVRSDGPGGEPVVGELAGPRGSRMHVVRAGAGTLTISYEATLTPAPPPAVAPSGAGAGEPLAGGPVDLDAVVGLRQSRFCPSDALAGFAAGEFGGLAGDADIAGAVAAWVFERLAYEPGSSGPLDTAVDTLLAGSGVCRDFAHLTIALCRALGVPARLVAVYAPGLSPMDFHAVVEVRRGGCWEVVDPTRLAPRSSLVRISTGRDAGDTAFATTLRGSVELISARVFAVVDGDLPRDDHVAPVAIA